MDALVHFQAGKGADDVNVCRSVAGDCDFEKPFSSCGYTQGRDDDLDWEQVDTSEKPSLDPWMPPVWVKRFSREPPVQTVSVFIGERSAPVWPSSRVRRAQRLDSWLGLFSSEAGLSVWTRGSGLFSSEEGSASGLVVQVSSRVRRAQRLDSWFRSLLESWGSQNVLADRLQRDGNL
ncbi:hypothetical protein PO909_031685 [Leuciscus waleckii]